MVLFFGLLLLKYEEKIKQDNEPDDDFIVAPPAVTAAVPVIKQSPVVTVDETKAYWCGCTPADLPGHCFSFQKITLQ